MDSAKPPEPSALAGPAAVTIKVASPRGPFARKGASIPLPPTQIRIANAGAVLLTIAPLMFEPLHWAESGAAADANLAANVAQRELQPGESTLLTISGRVPAEPGAYASTLRVAAQDGTRLPIRIEFRVAAGAAWGFGCMVLGLLAVGLLSLLDGESGIRGKLRHALIERQDAHEFLQRSPPPQSRTAQVAGMNREFDAAIESLQKPRAFSFVDQRSPDAQEHLDSAKAISGKLHDAMDATPRGAIEVADLDGEWKILRQNFADTASRFLLQPQPGMALAQRLAAYDAWVAQRLLTLPLRQYTEEFDYQVNRVKEQAKLANYYVQLSHNNIDTAERVRRRAEAAGISPDRRGSILRMLDEASAALTEPFDWPMRRTVSERIQSARTEALRAETEAVLAAALTARAQEEKDDSLAPIEAVVAEGAKLKRGADGKIDPAEKTKWLQRTVAAWRTRLATFPEPPPPTMNAELDALAAAVDAGDLNAVATRSRGMFDQWAAYTTARAQGMMLKATAPFCLRLRDDTLVDLQASQESMRRLEAHLNLPKWEGQLDQLAMQARATPDVAENVPPNCLTQMVDLSGKAYNLSNEIDSALWDATVLPDATKRQLALDLRGSLTPETLRNLLSDSRVLQIEVATPPEERYVGREIEFKVANLDPIWGPGVTLAMDFGDRQVKTATAEDMRKNKWFTHAYAGANSAATPTVVAAEAFQPGTITPVGKTLGQGEASAMSISPSPISLARLVADWLFNVRFGLALLIAGLLYFWRYFSMSHVFGANRFDYAQAFALGFAVSFAVEQLPKGLADFIK